MKLSETCFVLCLLGTGSFVSAQTPAPEAPASETPAAVPAKRPLLKYTAPKSATSGGGRIDGDGGSRGTGGKLPSVYVLAPAGDAFTTRKQPALFFSQIGSAAESAGHTLTLTLVEPNKPAPLIKAVTDKSEPGIRRVQLFRHGVELQPGIRYDWRGAAGFRGGGKTQGILSARSTQVRETAQGLWGAFGAGPSGEGAHFSG